MADTETLSTLQDVIVVGYNLAVSLLARREHSVVELRTKLSVKMAGRVDDQGLVEPALTEIIDRLQRDNYLSDSRYAEVYAAARLRKGFGAERIALELNEKRVSEEIVAAVLADMESLWFEAMLSTWRKKFRHPPDGFKEKAKQQQFLRYRGYRFQDIDKLFAELNVNF